MNALSILPSCGRSLGLGASVALALFVSDPAMAGCALDKSLCDSACHRSPFGGLGGGIVGGLDLGSCENSCSTKYRLCMTGHAGNSPEAIRRAKDADKAYEAQLERNLKLAVLHQQKAKADRESAERAELQLLLKWHARYPDPAQDGLSEFQPGIIAVVTRAIPLRSSFPSPEYGSGSTYSQDVLDTSGAKLNERLYPVIGFLPVGTKVEITNASDNGAISVKQIDGEFPGHTGQVVAGALRLLPSSLVRN